jgi:hypothetical protein
MFALFPEILNISSSLYIYATSAKISRAFLHLSRGCMDAGNKISLNKKMKNLIVLFEFCNVYACFEEKKLKIKLNLLPDYLTFLPHHNASGNIFF